MHKEFTPQDLFDINAFYILISLRETLKESHPKAFLSVTRFCFTFDCSLI